ncbi:cation:dicarboxylate symporter family transporter, partial [Pseudomonas aeruginosa]
METPAMFIKRCSRSIFLQVVIGLVIGVICGVGIPDLAVQMKPLGDGFIKLIKM